MKVYSLLIIIFLSSLFLSCRKDVLLTDSSVKLEFSKDTLTFDTVFTTVGSATKYFIVYNPNNKAIKISDIHLAGGSSSAFHLNIDGSSTHSVKDVEIAAKDSLYIFAAVTVDPGNTDNPFVIEDSILFTTNGNSQRVLLQAWGQDAHFFRDSVITADQTWENDKPYVIINSGSSLKFGLFVDEGVTLTIKPGCRIYSHPGAYIFVAGTLKAGGDGDSVTFQGDRLEKYFQNLPGNWGGIWFLKTSKNNVIENTVIRDGSIGIRCDSLGEQPVAKLTMKRTIIKNMLYAGLRCFTSTVNAENCLIFNVGSENCVQLVLGGLYNFKNCTFANYSSAVFNHQKPVVYMSNYYAVNNVIYGVGDLKADFSNCIIYGSLDKELSLDNYAGPPASLFEATFNHCCIKTTESVSGSGNLFSKDFNYPQFVDVTKDNYKITSFSPCRNAGEANGVTVDLENITRDGTIDIGAYEYH